MHIIFKFSLHREQWNIYLIKSQYKCFSVENTFCGDRCIEEVYLELCCLWRITRPRSLIKLKVVTKQVFVDEELNLFLCTWTLWVPSVNLHHTVYFGNKPKACKEANCSCKKEEDQNHYHGITEVQNRTCCPCDL